MNTISKKKIIAKSEKVIWYITMLSDHPSKVMHWNTASSPYRRLSKFVTLLFGF